ncbi:MAG: multidrug effflux MFS transporter [Pseudomonadota bacterium]
MSQLTEGAPVSRWMDRATAPHIVTLVLITGIGALNMNIFLPSLPAIADWYQADYAVVQLTISAYLGVTAILQILVGPLSDRYGRRPVLLGSLMVFLLATIGCLLAPTIEIFLAFRFLQAGIATSIALSRAIVRDMVPPNEAASMLGYVTMGMTLVPMLGPAVGGLLQEIFGWQSTLWVLLAAGGAVLFIVWADLGETNRNRSASFNEQFRAYPELLRSPRFWGYAAAAAFASGAFFAFLGGGSFVASTLLGMDPSEVGLYFAFIAVGYMLGNFLTGRYAARMGINRMLMLGAIVASTGMLITMGFFAVGMGTPLTFFGPILLVGLGNGLTLPSANVGLVSVRPHLAGSASGLGGAMMVGGGAALSAIAGSVLTVETGVWPLLLIMFSASALVIPVTLYLMWRTRQVGGL